MGRSCGVQSAAQHAVARLLDHRVGHIGNDALDQPVGAGGLDVQAGLVVARRVVRVRLGSTEDVLRCGVQQRLNAVVAVEVRLDFAAVELESRRR